MMMVVEEGGCGGRSYLAETMVVALVVDVTQRQQQ